MSATMIDLAPLCAIQVGPWYADPVNLQLVSIAIAAFCMGWLIGEWRSA